MWRDVQHRALTVWFSPRLQARFEILQQLRNPATRQNLHNMPHARAKPSMATTASIWKLASAPFGRSQGSTSFAVRDGAHASPPRPSSSAMRGTRSAGFAEDVSGALAKISPPNPQGFDAAVANFQRLGDPKQKSPHSSGALADGPGAGNPFAAALHAASPDSSPWAVRSASMENGDAHADVLAARLSSHAAAETSGTSGASMAPLAVRTSVVAGLITQTSLEQVLNALPDAPLPNGDAVVIDIDPQRQNSVTFSPAMQRTPGQDHAVATPSTSTLTQPQASPDAAAQHVADATPHTPQPPAVQPRSPHGGLRPGTGATGALSQLLQNGQQTQTGLQHQTSSLSQWSQATPRGNYPYAPFAVTVDVIDYEVLDFGRLLGAGSEGEVYAAWYQVGCAGPSPVSKMIFSHFITSIPIIQSLIQIAVVCCIGRF